MNDYIIIIYYDNLIFNYELEKEKKEVKYNNFTISPNSKIIGNIVLDFFSQKSTTIRINTNFVWCCI